MSIEEIKDALATTQAMYALYLGSKAKWDGAEKEYAVKAAEAKLEYEAKIAAERKKVEAAHKATDEAEASLKAYQEKVQSDLGVVIDLLAKPSGGHTRL